MYTQRLPQGATRFGAYIWTLFKYGFLTCLVVAIFGTIGAKLFPLEGLTLEHARFGAWAMAQETVESRLHTPANADFGPFNDDGLIVTGDSVFTVQSYVDVPTASDATKRIGFVCNVKYKGGDPDSVTNWQMLNILTY